MRARRGWRAGVRGLVASARGLGTSWLGERRLRGAALQVMSRAMPPRQRSTTARRRGRWAAGPGPGGREVGPWKETWAVTAAKRSRQRGQRRGHWATARGVRTSVDASGEPYGWQERRLWQERRRQEHGEESGAGRRPDGPSRPGARRREELASEDCQHPEREERHALGRLRVLTPEPATVPAPKKPLPAEAPPWRPKGPALSWVWIRGIQPDLAAASPGAGIGAGVQEPSPVPAL